MKKKLTLARRNRIGEILKGLGPDAGLNVKAAKIAACLGEPCTHGQALSLLAQCRKSRRKSGKTAEQINDERFQRHRARRPDLYA